MCEKRGFSGKDNIRGLKEGISRPYDHPELY